MDEGVYHPLLKNYSYFMPTKVVFGVNSISRLREELKPFAFKKALLLTGRTVRQTEAYSAIREVLSSLGKSVEFTNVSPEPDASLLANLTEEVRRNPPDIVVGLGGGSTMDMAKIASLVATNEKEPLKYFKGEPVARKGPPIVTIPTISGTGSEVTPISILVEKTAKLALRHHALYPSLAIIDPSLSITAPPTATASAGMDALCHAVESIMSVDSNPITSSLAFEAIDLVDECLEKAYCNGSDIEARNGLALASVLAGMAFANAGLCIAHGIAYTYAMRCGLPHGTSVSVAEPYAVEFNAPAIPEKMKIIAAGLGIDTEGLTSSEVGEAVAMRMLDITGTLGLPMSLEDLELGEEDLEPMVDDLLKNYHRFIAKNPRKPSREDLLFLYKTMLEGY